MIKSSASECKGCTIKHLHCLSSSIFQEGERIYNCPCNICLVKSMCNTSYCDEFHQYSNDYRDHVKKNAQRYKEYKKNQTKKQSGIV